MRCCKQAHPKVGDRVTLTEPRFGRYATVTTVFCSMEDPHVDYAVKTDKVNGHDWLVFLKGIDSCSKVQP